MLELKGRNWGIEWSMDKEKKEFGRQCPLGMF